MQYISGTAAERFSDACILSSYYRDDKCNGGNTGLNLLKKKVLSQMDPLGIRQLCMFLGSKITIFPLPAPEQACTKAVQACNKVNQDK